MPCRDQIIVVGGGHAGVEAALACARMGAKVVMFTFLEDNIASMPCNPAIGGPGKAQLVSEIDALGGEMGLATDCSTIQLRLLNASKGPAVQSMRAQVDKGLYSKYMRRALETAGVVVRTGMVTGIEEKDGKVTGVVLQGGERVSGDAVIVCSGVYLESRIVMGRTISESGPLGEPSAKGLSSSLGSLGFRLGRFKTGTSPRIAKDSVDWSSLRKEEGTQIPLAFSFMSPLRTWELDACYSTYTNEDTHRVIMENRHRAPMLDGTIEGIGPRYCPSIEYKVTRFPQRPRHQVYLEIESADSQDVYILGLSTSLPLDVQEVMVRTLPGLGNAYITRPGYAIEYDFVLPSQLKPTLEAVEVGGLYFAGQVAGTSGYEEAAGQGLVAGVNAVLSLRGEEPLVFLRDEAYLGVLLDDLVKCAVDEPYRMLTSRCEYRLLLRQGNADQRLTPLGRRLGLVDEPRWALFNEKMEKLGLGRELVGTIVSGSTVRDGLRVPSRRIDEYLDQVPGLRQIPPEVRSEVEIEAKYAGFVERQEREAKRLRRYENKRIPADAPTCVPGLSNETRDRLRKYAPATIRGALAAGVSPSDALVILAYLKDRERGGTQGAYR